MSPDKRLFTRAAAPCVTAFKLSYPQRSYGGATRLESRHILPSITAPPRRMETTRVGTVHLLYVKQDSWTRCGPSRDG